MGRGQQQASAGAVGSAPAKRKTYTADDFAAEVRTWSNERLIDKAGQAILGAAVMSSHSRFNNGRDDALCDAIYDECQRRDNPDLYQRGYNEAVRSQGHNGMVTSVSIPISQGEELREEAPAETAAV